MEMSAASAQAFAHRAGRQNTPAQVMAMGTEKLAATLESSTAVARHMLAFRGTNPLAVWSAWAAMLGGAMTPYRVRAVRNARSARVRR